MNGNNTRNNNISAWPSANNSIQPLSFVCVLVASFKIFELGKEMIHFRNNERDHEPELTMKISLIPLEMGHNITLYMEAYTQKQGKSLVSFPLIVSLRQ